MIVVVGAGPGVSGSVARRFADEGYDVALLGQDQQAIDDLRAGPGGARRDRRPCRRRRHRRAGRRDAVRRFGEHTGRIDVLHFNPSAFREKDPLTLSVAELLEDVALGVGALLTVVQAARPYMSAGGRISVTGSMAADDPWEGAASLGVQKAGVRNLVHSLDKSLGPGRHPRGLGDRPRRAVARGCLHPGPGRRGDLVRRRARGVAVDQRGFLPRLTSTE